MPNTEGEGKPSKALGPALAIVALVAAFTGLFMPIKGYVDRQNDTQRQLQGLRQQQDEDLRALSNRITKLETLLDAYQTYPPVLSK